MTRSFPSAKSLFPHIFLPAVFFFALLGMCHFPSTATATDPPAVNGQVVEEEATGKDTPVEMLGSLLQLQQNLREQIEISTRQLQESSSEAEKKALEYEIGRLDKQLSDAADDFERIATGVDPQLFVEKMPENFSWREELASLLEPAIKEMKRFTIRARQKSRLREQISELELLSDASRDAVDHLEMVLADSENEGVDQKVQTLLPEWKNTRDRLEQKLELQRSELRRLNAQETSLVESAQVSVRDFFRARGLYLFIAITSFVTILLGFRLLYRLAVKFYSRFGKKEERSFRIRFLYVVFQALSVVMAIIGLFFVLYLAEDWFLLSMAIIFFLGLAWTIRQGAPRLWQQARLMLNVGSVREGERLVMHGVPWRIEAINVFTKLVNPALEIELRVPIETLIGRISRPAGPDEPWFPCRRGDWVMLADGQRGKVVNLSHEMVEIVERGGRRVTYTTMNFLDGNPANLSRNFRLRVPFGVSYNYQNQVTTHFLSTFKDYLSARLEEAGYGKDCLNLQVEFLQAGESSLDMMVLADFDGSVAAIYRRLERAIQKFCVDCCTENGWEIPFPQLTVHKGDSMSDVPQT